MERRDFLLKAGIAALGAGALSAGCKVESTYGTIGYKGDVYQWKMVTAWPPRFPILGEGAVRLAEQIKAMSGGRLQIQVFGGGELVPPLEAFDAVSQGVAEMCHSAAYYWAGKIPASPFFTAIPFGMNTDQFNAWIQYGGGKELWEEVYAAYNAVPFICGNTGAQMGGWFKKEVNSLADLNGVKMRIPGIGGKVMTKLGVATVLSPGSELYTNLERGVIDALEWIGPYHDYLMGFYRLAQYYYYPGWQEPTAAIELVVNKTAYEKLPKDLQDIVRTACASENTRVFAECMQKNMEHLQMFEAMPEISIKEFPKEVLAALREKTAEVITEITDADPMSKKVYESYLAFQKQSYRYTSRIEQTPEAFSTSAQ